MKPVNNRLGRGPLLGCCQGNWHPVLIRTADENDIRTLQPVVFHIDVRRKIGAGQMTEVNLSIGIRQRTCHQNLHAAKDTSLHPQVKQTPVHQPSITNAAQTRLHPGPYLDNSDHDPFWVSARPSSSLTPEPFSEPIPKPIPGDIAEIIPYPNPHLIPTISPYPDRDKTNYHPGNHWGVYPGYTPGREVPNR